MARLYIKVKTLITPFAKNLAIFHNFKSRRDLEGIQNRSHRRFTSDLRGTTTKQFDSKKALTI